MQVGCGRARSFASSGFEPRVAYRCIRGESGSGSGLGLGVAPLVPLHMPAIEIMPVPHDGAAAPGAAGAAGAAAGWSCLAMCDALAAAGPCLANQAALAAASSADILTTCGRQVRKRVTGRGGRLRSCDGPGPPASRRASKRTPTSYLSVRACSSERTASLGWEMSRGCDGAGVWKAAATATHERENTRCIVALEDWLGESRWRFKPLHPSECSSSGMREGGKAERIRG